MDISIKTKHELEFIAKSNLESNPDEAVKTYKSMYKYYPDQFSSWDAFYSIKAMRLSTSFDMFWASELAERYKDKIVNGLYGWLIFDKCIKGKKRTEIINNEQHILSLINLSAQKNVKEKDRFPCPTTLSILKLCEAHSQNLFNARKINELLSELDYKLLSIKAQSIYTQTRGNVELSSDLEKYFALKSKALLKLREFESCIEISSLALQLIPKFHYDNDLWFKMRIALSEDGLGNVEKSERLFKELLNSKSGSGKWFLYRDIAQLYYEQKNFEKSWKYAVDATFYGTEPHFLIGLYMLQARLLFKLNRSFEASTLAELIASILKEQQWNDKVEYNKLFSHFNIDRINVKSVREIMKKLDVFWRNERYGNKTKSKGVIISIYPNGKGGKIKDSNGVIIGFSKKNFLNRPQSHHNLKGTNVVFYVMKNFEGKDIAENITVMSFKNKKNSNDSNLQKDQKFEGEITKILNDNERGKNGFVRNNGKEYYFSVNQNFRSYLKIVVGTRVIFEILPAKYDRKEKARIKEILE